MKNYIQPEINVIEITSEDIIAASGLSAGSGTITGGTGSKWD